MRVTRHDPLRRIAYSFNLSNEVNKQGGVPLAPAGVILFFLSGVDQFPTDSEQLLRSRKLFWVCPLHPEVEQNRFILGHEERLDVSRDSAYDLLDLLPDALCLIDDALPA